MSDRTDYSNRRSSDYHSRSHHRDRRDRDRNRDRDRYDRHSRDHRDYYDRHDSYRHERNQRRVPGLVTDPDGHADDSDSAITRGQREAMERYRTDGYYTKNDGGSRVGTKTKDTMSSPPPYNITAISQPYIPTSHRTYGGYGRKSRRRIPINAIMLSMFAGIVALGLLIAAIVLVDWIVEFNTAAIVTRTGLFQRCSAGSCATLEQSAAAEPITELQQATRALIIIAAIFNFFSLIICFYFGVNRWERPRGAYYVGALFLLAGCCSVAAMGCFSAVLTQQINKTTTAAAVVPGTSFFLGWFGTACLFLASLGSFFANTTAWKKK